MAQAIVIGDLNVSRTVETLRTNESLQVISSTGGISAVLGKSIQLTGSNAIVATLPAANVAPLRIGSQYFIINDSSATATIAQSGGATLGTMAPGNTALVTLTGIADAAGTWDFAILNAAATGVTKFVSSFNNLASWGSAVSGEFSLTVTASTHGRGINPNFDIFRTNGVNFDLVNGIQAVLNASGDLTLTINETPSELFAGKIILV